MMNVFALAASADAAELTFADRATTALIVSLQGMLTIFLVLSILWGAIELLHLVIGKEKKAKTVAPAPAAQDAPTPAAAPAPAAPVADDGAIVAAITAAITAQLANEGYTGGFRVVSFKRVSASSKRRA